MSPGKRLFLCLALALVVMQAANAQTKKSVPAGGQAKKAAPPPATSSRYDGDWVGETSQGLEISFTVVKGKVTGFSLGGRFQGTGCSTTSSTQTTLNAPIAGASFAAGIHGGIGMSFTVRGSFSGAAASAKAVGTADLSYQSAPGPPPGVPGYVPPCVATASVAWAAARGKGKASAIPPSAESSSATSTAPGSKSAPPAVNRENDGMWEGKTDQAKAISFTVVDGVVTNLTVTGDFKVHGCEPDMSVSTGLKLPVQGTSFRGAFFLSSDKSMQLIDLSGSFQAGPPAKASGTIKLAPREMKCMFIDTKWEASRKAATP